MEFIEILEIIVIGGLILLQIGIAIKLWKRISIYKAIFDRIPDIKQNTLPSSVLSGDVFTNIQSLAQIPEDELDGFTGEDDLIEITYLKNNSENNILKNMVSQLNTYLIKNRGATIDFHLIKDTVDRNTDIIEDEINNRIPAPLYIGLAATMIGIIFGLYAVNFDIKGNGALNAIQPLINGVKIAMSASVIGLIITTFFSVKTYKDANLKVEEEKNNFLSQLQSDLLPKMNRSKLPEVAILSQKLDHFARTTTGAISKFTEIVHTSSDSIQREEQLLKGIKALNVKEITSQNLKVFNRIDEMMGSFKSFAKYYDQLDRSMGSTTLLLQNLDKFVENTQDVNLILNGIKVTIEKSNDTTDFFNKHVKSFASYNDSVNEAVTDNNVEFNKAMSQLKQATQKQAESYLEVVSDYDSKMTGAFEKSISNFNNSMANQVQRTEEAFEVGRPRFEKLDQLDKLEQLKKLDQIDERLTNLEVNLSKSFANNSRDIVNAINNIKINTVTYNPPKAPKRPPHPENNIEDEGKKGFMSGIASFFGFSNSKKQLNVVTGETKIKENKTSSKLEKEQIKPNEKDFKKPEIIRVNQKITEKVKFDSKEHSSHILKEKKNLLNNP